MQVFTIKGMHIDGVVACVPQRRIDNEEALADLYGDEARKIISATGIKARYIVNRGTSTSDLCIACARRLLEATGTAAGEIGAVVFVTFTPDRPMPFNAAVVQYELGLPKGIPSFDMSLACSGYAYGLYVASQLAKASGRKALLLDGDVQSACMSPYDKATTPVLADAGSATLVSCDGGEQDWRFTFYTDGSGKDVLTIPKGGSAAPATPADLKFVDHDGEGSRRETDIYMDGFAVFRFVAMDVSRWLARFLDEVGESSETIDSFVPHQANMYMIKKLARKLKFSWDRTWQSGDEVGNSASATVPVTIAKNAAQFLKGEKGHKVLLSGFGAGLSASAGIAQLDPKAFYEFFQYRDKDEVDGE